MSKIRRFAVKHLAKEAVGNLLVLSDDEAKHARVLRVEAGDTIALFDPQGRSGEAVIENIAPDAIVRRGPRGPSGVMLMCRRSSRSSRMSAAAAPRVVEPRATPQPRCLIVWAINSPSRCSLARASIRRDPRRRIGINMYSCQPR